MKIGTRQVSLRLILALVLVTLTGLVPQRGGAQPANWTKGHRKILVIPVRFTDRAGPSDSDARGFTGWTALTNGTAQAEINAFFLKQSYNQFSVDFTILPEINLGVSSSYYTNICPGTTSTKWTVWGAPGSLADDARDKARAMGLTNGMAALFDSANYDLDVIATGYLPTQAGAASDGGRAVIAFNYFTALPHELCHCLGLQHANGYSRASMVIPVKSGSYFYQAYGDVYCLMGWKENSRTAFPAPDRDVNTYFKYELGWLTTNNICTPDAAGLYRIFAFDQGALTPGSNYAMRITRDASHTYWFDFRQAITNFPDAKWSQNGLEVHFGAEEPRSSSGATVLWDMTPGSRGPTGTTFATMHDAPLLIGRTYTDAEANLHVTPVGKGGTSPESLDVMVNFGPFPGNHAPTVSISPATVTLGAGTGQTFTAAASDPDGDTLTYYWEFDDDTKSGGTDFGALNADSRLATNSVHAWSRKGLNFVRCTVSDMKGWTMTASAEVTITNGLPAPVTISGVVKDESGNPLDGALVNNFRSVGAYESTNFAGSSVTAADGKYQITVPRTNATYVFTTLYKGYSFSNSAGGTVTVAAASVTNVDFTRVRTKRTLSGGVYVAGHGYASSTYGDLTVSDGTQSVAVTNGGWQLSVDDGSLITLTATASNPAYTVTSDFPQPYPVVDDAATLHFFVDVPGGMPQAGFPTSGTNSDDTVGTVNIPVTLTLPPGFTNWGGDQVFSLQIDGSSTAEYGVDYKTRGAMITFYGALTPSPYLLPLTVIHDAVPKTKTVVLKLIPGSSVASLGPVSTFTYTIHNAPYPTRLSGVAITNGMMSFCITNLTPLATNYVLQCHDLVSPIWTTSHIFTGSSGQFHWNEAISNGWDKVFYRVISE
jgi:hypothetical protein